MDIRTQESLLYTVIVEEFSSSVSFLIVASAWYLQRDAPVASAGATNVWKKHDKIYSNSVVYYILKLSICSESKMKKFWKKKLGN